MTLRCPCRAPLRAAEHCAGADPGRDGREAAALRSPGRWRCPQGRAALGEAEAGRRRGRARPHERGVVTPSGGDGAARPGGQRGQAVCAGCAGGAYVPVDMGRDSGVDAGSHVGARRGERTPPAPSSAKIPRVLALRIMQCPVPLGRHSLLKSLQECGVGTAVI